MSDLQVLVHLLEGLLGLGEEVVDDGLGELALFFVVVHFEDLVRSETNGKKGAKARGTTALRRLAYLFESVGIDVTVEVGEAGWAGGAILGLYTLTLAQSATDILLIGDCWR